MRFHSLNIQAASRSVKKQQRVVQVRGDVRLLIAGFGRNRPNISHGGRKAQKVPKS
jgi:hypothetical protein